MSALTFQTPFEPEEAFARIRVLLENQGYRLESSQTRLWFSLYFHGRLIRTITVEFKPGRQVAIKSRTRTLWAIPTTKDLEMVRDWLKVRAAPMEGVPWPSPPFPSLSAYLSPYPRADAEEEPEVKIPIPDESRPMQAATTPGYPLIESHQSERFMVSRDLLTVYSRIRAFAHEFGYVPVHADSGLTFRRGRAPGSLDNTSIMHWSATLSARVTPDVGGSCSVVLERAIAAELHPQHLAALTHLLELELKDMRSYVAVLEEPRNLPWFYGRVTLEAYSHRRDLAHKRESNLTIGTLVMVGLALSIFYFNFTYLLFAVIVALILFPMGAKTECVTYPEVDRRQVRHIDPQPFEHLPAPPP